MEFRYGQGARLYTATGKEYIDLSAGIAVNSLGHNHPRLVEALRDQVGKLIHISNLYRIPEQEELAERLKSWTRYERFFFCNSGTEANEAALKIVKAYGNRCGKHRIVVAEQGFHGRTLGSLSLTAQDEFQAPFRPLLPDVITVPFGDLTALEKLLDDQVAGVFLEPIQAEGGGNFPPPGYLAKVRELTQRHGAALVFDEVQTGIGRTGAPLYSLREGVLGDLVTLGKGLGGGIPVGAVGVNPPFTEILKPGDHASTFGGNPLAMRAALIVLTEISQSGFLTMVQRKGEGILKTLQEWERDGLITNPRGAGLLIFFGISDPRSLAEIALSEGVLVVPTKNRAVRLTPPLLISESEIEEGLNRLHNALIRYSQEVRHASPSP